MRFAWAALLALACARGPKSVGEAQAAVRAADARGVYDLVDQPTRWSIDSTFKYHQQSLAAIEESYPAELQAREKARFCDGDDARAFFVAYEARYRLTANAPAEKSDFVEEKGRWRWSGLRAKWEDIKQRASHDVDTVRESAAAYKRASR